MTAPPAGVPSPVTIVGVGRAGRGIAVAARAAGLEVVLVDRTRVVDAPARTHDDAIRAAPLLLLAMQDTQLDPALRAIHALRTDVGPAVVLQVSGSAEPAFRARMESSGHHYGTFHPLLPLGDPAIAVARFRGAVIGVEGDHPARSAAAALATALGATTIEIPAADRAAYHAAAVLASNFPVALAALAESLLHRIGVSDDEAHRAVRVLMAASVDNLTVATRAIDALTGPMVRGDGATVRGHVRALAESPTAHAAYIALSTATIELLQARGAIDEEESAWLRESLGR